MWWDIKLLPISEEQWVLILGNFFYHLVSKIRAYSRVSPYLMMGPYSRGALNRSITVISMIAVFNPIFIWFCGPLELNQDTNITVTYQSGFFYSRLTARNIHPKIQNTTTNAECSTSWINKKYAFPVSRRRIHLYSEKKSFM